MGMGVFLMGLFIFSIIPFLGNLRLTDKIASQVLTEQEYENLATPLKADVLNVTYSTTFAFSRDFIHVFNEVNEQLKNK
jgi:ferredoxin-type protein NapH